MPSICWRWVGINKSNQSAQQLEQSSNFGSFPTSIFLVKPYSCGLVFLGTTQLLTFGMPATFFKH